MSDRYQKIGVVVRRFPVSVLNDIVYCATPMPLELAESIRQPRLLGTLSLMSNKPRLGTPLRTDLDPAQNA